MNFNNGRYEIGSHFWLEHTYFRKTKNNLLCFCNIVDSVFTFSGRSAINIALRDAMQTKKIIKAYLPFKKALLYQICLGRKGIRKHISLQMRSNPVSP